MRNHNVLRPIDLARAAGISVQQVRNYEAWGFLPVAPRSPTGYRQFTATHLRAIEVARVMIAGHGWQSALRIMHATHGGDRLAALAEIDARHAELHRRRDELEQTLKLLRLTAASRTPTVDAPALGRARPATIGEVARHVHVRVSALRFWEAQGLLHPERDRPSGYRHYDERQVRRVEVVALLRQAGYNFEAISTVLDQLAAGRPAHAVAAAERRLDDLAEASRRCTQATAAWWDYAVSLDATVQDNADDEESRQS